MVKLINRNLCYVPLVFFILPLLVGCPWSGDQWRFDEEAPIIIKGNSICLNVVNPEGYQPKNIAINPRGTHTKDQGITFNPELSLVGNQLCIPPTFYHFPNEGQFIISTVLTSTVNISEPRRLVAAVEISQGIITSIPLTDLEIVRPYSEMVKP
ncbi:putative T6SS immunity periplasmic lipoprotein [Erwinia billingiae]|uniref:putative T6SS immunity periplasmic lipoprotein n=1 Tax=Erwinia billingiae TaxID=182337 RepID=UPI0012448330|nr:putative T6SS immunity periplasmic lipoprotein [Erwinia billingiae]